MRGDPHGAARRGPQPSPGSFEGRRGAFGPGRNPVASGVVRRSRGGPSRRFAWQPGERPRRELRQRRRTDLAGGPGPPGGDVRADPRHPCRGLISRLVEDGPRPRGCECGNVPGAHGRGHCRTHCRDHGRGTSLPIAVRMAVHTAVPMIVPMVVHMRVHMTVRRRFAAFRRPRERGNTLRIPEPEAGAFGRGEYREAALRQIGAPPDIPGMGPSSGPIRGGAPFRAWGRVLVNRRSERAAGTQEGVRWRSRRHGCRRSASSPSPTS